MRARVLMLAIASVVFAPGARATTDYIFANSFEIECDGGACTYCSPADPTPVCGASSHCLPQENTTSVCSYPAGAGTQGALCSSNADCAGPYACIQGFSLSCAKWCAVGLPGNCPVSTTCYSLVPPVFTGGTEWGVCQ